MINNESPICMTTCIETLCVLIYCLIYLILRMLLSTCWDAVFSSMTYHSSHSYTCYTLSSYLFRLPILGSVWSRTTSHGITIHYMRPTVFSGHFYLFYLQSTCFIATYGFVSTSLLWVSKSWIIFIMFRPTYYCTFNICSEAVPQSTIPQVHAT